MSELRKVRVSQNPSVELEVDEAEYNDLRYQGLLVTAKGEPVTESKVTTNKKEN